jgi:hypothetical protein
VELGEIRFGRVDLYNSSLFPYYKRLTAVYRCLYFSRNLIKLVRISLT